MLLWFKAHAFIIDFQHFSYAKTSKAEAEEKLHQVAKKKKLDTDVFI